MIGNRPADVGEMVAPDHWRGSRQGWTMFLRTPLVPPYPSSPGTPAGKGKCHAGWNRLAAAARTDQGS
jgi:hypothetical protein